MHSNIDPDKQLLRSVVSSNDKYYLESKFNQFILKENTVGKLSILHGNIRSLNKNLDNLLILLQLLQYKFSILAICETWETNSNVDIFQIPGYVKVSSPHRSGVGGEVALFNELGFNLKVRNDLIHC